jgi:hypothetical protein
MKVLDGSTARKDNEIICLTIYVNNRIDIAIPRDYCMNVFLLYYKSFLVSKEFNHGF